MYLCVVMSLVKLLYIKVVQVQRYTLFTQFTGFDGRQGGPWNHTLTYIHFINTSDHVLLLSQLEKEGFLN